MKEKAKTFKRWLEINLVMLLTWIRIHQILWIRIHITGSKGSNVHCNYMVLGENILPRNLKMKNLFLAS